MLIGVNTWVWTSPLADADIPALAPRRARWGSTCSSCRSRRSTATTCAGRARRSRRRGSPASSTLVFPPDRDLIHPDAGPRENAARYIRGAIDAAAALGSQTLSGPALRERRPRVAADARRARARPRAPRRRRSAPLSAYAADAGVRLGLEPLNRFETSFVNIADQAIEIIDRVDSPGLGILLDTFHMNLEEKSIGDAIRATGSRLSHFHACENDRGAPGSGHVPWDEVADALHAIDFEGPVVIESFTDQVVTIAARGRRLATGRREPGRARGRRRRLPAGAARMTGLRELRPFGHSSWSAPFPTRPRCGCRAPRRRP